MMTSYMLDTNIFNLIDDEKFQLSDLVGTNDDVYATHIQLDELKDSSPERYNKLLNCFKEINSEITPPSISSWGEEDWDSGLWGKEIDHEVFDKILKALPERPKKPINPDRDARLAVTAISNNFVLITNDSNLNDAVCNSNYSKNIKFIRENILNANH